MQMGDGSLLNRRLGSEEDDVGTSIDELGPCSVSHGKARLILGAIELNWVC